MRRMASAATAAIGRSDAHSAIGGSNGIGMTGAMTGSYGRELILAKDTHSGHTNDPYGFGFSTTGAS